MERITPAENTESDDLFADVQPETSRRVLLAAVDAFATRGYSAATTREIADRVGLSPAAVYVHFRSKEELLYQISLVGNQSSLDAVERALDDATAPAGRLHAFVTTFVAWHARNQTLARVIEYELEALSAGHSVEISGIRRRREGLLRAELRRGERTGDFEIDDPDLASTAILSMGIDVARWYSVGMLTPETLGSRYADLALNMVAARRPEG